MRFNAAVNFSEALFNRVCNVVLFCGLPRDDILDIMDTWYAMSSASSIRDKSKVLFDALPLVSSSLKLVISSLENPLQAHVTISCSSSK